MSRVCAWPKLRIGSIPTTVPIEDLIGAHYMKRQFQPGQIARIGDIEGEILELTATGVVLATPEGRTLVPAKAFNQQALVLVTPADGNE